MSGQKLFVRIAFLAIAGAIGVGLWRYSHTDDSLPIAIQIKPVAQHAAATTQSRGDSLAIKRRQLLVAQHEQERQLKDELAASDQRILELPTWVSSVDIGTDGQPIFYSRESVNEAEKPLRESAERFAAGQSRVIRKGRLLLADLQGRLWLRELAYDPRLYCLDHHRWQVCSATGLVDDAAGATARTGYAGAWQDRKGNIWLLSFSKQGCFVQRIGADGSWTDQQIAALNDPRISRLRSDAYIVEQQNGLMTITSDLRGGNSASSGVLCFDGKQWAVVLPQGCTSRSHDVMQIVPLLNGSILTTCSGGRAWINWPPAAAEQNKHNIIRWIGQLDDPAYEVRRAAFELLSLAGESAKPSLLAAQPSASPESQGSIEDLLAAIPAVEKDAAADDHDRTRLYSGRYQYSLATVCARDWHGKAILLLHDFHDKMKTARPSEENTTQPAEKISNGYALAVVQADGTWEVHPLDDDQLHQAGWQFPPDHLFVDSKNQLWADQRLYLHDDLTLVLDNTPQRLPIGMRGVDSAGVIYSDSGDGRLIAERPLEVALATPPLPYKSFTVENAKVSPEHDYAIDIQYHATKAPVKTSEVFRLDREQAPLTKLEEPNGFIGSLLYVPLREDWIIARLLPAKDNLPIAHEGGIYDGKNWRLGSNLGDLVRDNAADLAKVAPTNWGSLDVQKLAGDGQGRLWYAEKSTEPQPDAQQFGVESYECDRFRYFDGARWHDVWADLNVAEGKPKSKPPTDGVHSALDEGYPGYREVMGTFNHGTEVLVSDGPQLPLAIHYENGKLMSNRITTEGKLLVPIPGPRLPPTPLPPPNDPRVTVGREPALKSALHSVFREGPDGDLWGSVGPDNQIICVKHDTAIADSHCGVVKRVDSKNRVWIDDIDPKTRTHTLRVKIGDRWIDPTIAKDEFAGAILEASDGRLFMVHRVGFAELVVDDKAGTVTEKDRWNWPLPPGGRFSVFIDTSDGLWYGTGETTITRIQLPTNGVTVPS